MKKFKLKTDDLVVVLNGKHKGATAKVLTVLKNSDQVILEKVNLVTRNVKPTSDRQGGRVEKEAPIHISNVALWNEDEKRPVKIGYRVEDGKKVRFDKKTNALID